MSRWRQQQKSVKAARADNPEGVCRIGVNSLKRADREDVIETTAGRIVSTVSRPSNLAKHQRAMGQMVSASTTKSKLMCDLITICGVVDAIRPFWACFLVNKSLIL